MKVEKETVFKILFALVACNTGRLQVHSIYRVTLTLQSNSSPNAPPCKGLSIKYGFNYERTQFYRNSI